MIRRCLFLLIVEMKNRRTEAIAVFKVKSELEVHFAVKLCLNPIQLTVKPTKNAKTDINTFLVLIY